MTHHGYSHVGLSTLDMDRTLDFYENILGFTRVRGDIMNVKEGGQIRHVFLDTGQGQLLAFMEPKGVEGIPSDYDAGINRGLGVPDGFYHFAFEAGSVTGLEKKRTELLEKGIKVSEIVDHDGWCKSIYFKDPNNIQLEYCCMTRELTPEDAELRVRAEISRRDRRDRG
ncbi:MAG: VOC family protein [Myxococcota bacterium]